MSKKKKEKYTIAFCDTPNLSSKFGSWGNTFETWEMTDAVIRMNWTQAIKVSEGCYAIDAAYLIIEKVTNS